MGLELIKGNRALVVSLEYLWIYAIPEMQENNTSTTMNLESLAAIYTIPLGGDGLMWALSRPCTQFHRTLLTFYTGSGILRVACPHDIESPPVVQTMKQFESNMQREGCMGLKKGFIFMPKSKVIALRYSREPESATDATATAQEYGFLDIGYSRHVCLMDEGSGRVLQPYSSGIVFVYQLGPYEVTCR